MKTMRFATRIQPDPRPHGLHCNTPACIYLPTVPGSPAVMKRIVGVDSQGFRLRASDLSEQQLGEPIMRVPGDLERLRPTNCLRKSPGTT